MFVATMIDEYNADNDCNWGWCTQISHIAQWKFHHCVMHFTTLCSMIWGKMHCIQIAYCVRNSAERYGGVYREQKISLAAAAAVSWGGRNLSRVWMNLTKVQKWRKIHFSCLSIIRQKDYSHLPWALEKRKNPNLWFFKRFCPSPLPEIVWIDQTEATWNYCLSW